MKSTLLPFLLCCNFSSLSQELKLTTDSDSSLWSKWTYELAGQLQIVPINQSSFDSEFRFWDGQKVIRLWESQGVLKGAVTFFIKEHTDGGAGRIYHSSISLDDNTIATIQQLTLDFQIKSLPTDQRIEGWSLGFDGITYRTETKNDSTYSFKSYWTPKAQKDLKEARFFQYYVNELERIRPISEAYERFRRKQPFDSYYSWFGGNVIVTKIK